MNFKSFCLSLLISVIAGCNGGGTAEINETVHTPSEPARPVSPDLSGFVNRPFRLGSTAVQMVPVAGEAIQNGHNDFPIATVAAEVDVVTIVPDFLGIPYDIFADGPTIAETHPWTVAMQTLIDKARAVGNPLMLQLGLVRESMVGRAWDNGGTLAVDLTWAPVCYDFAQPSANAIGDAYVNYAKWMADQFQPAYVVNFSEANLYYTMCGGAGTAWDNLVVIQQRAYDAIKEEVPEAKVFASFHLETLYDDKLDGWNETQYQAIAALSYDIFGMAAYPFGIRKPDGSFATPYDLPDDYFSRVASRHPEEKRLSVSETGWNNVSISVGDETECIENIPYSDESFVAAYLQFVLNSAYIAEFDIVNWFSFRDTIPATVLGTCYVRQNSNDPMDNACMGDFWCIAINHAKDNVPFEGAPQLFSEVVQKAFGAMGLREYDGTARSTLMDIWREHFALPVK